LGGYTVGALVQTNYGGVLTINGAPVGRELGKYYLREELERAAQEAGMQTRAAADEQAASRGLQDAADGSIIIIIATDAPVDARNLRRMAARGMMGLGRTGASGSNGSGDYVIAFSTAPEVRVRVARNTKPSEVLRPRDVKLLSNDAMSPLFLAVVEATEEAIYNSLFRAQTMTGRGGLTVEALPLERTLEILRKYNALSTKP
ncbi:MAG TPA: P1 family peptidase, partial [Pyrinomonadaceae bacterium]|nr:P1 family peptidase [Pyrinomonadaceae bacterium]